MHPLIIMVKSISASVSVLVWTSLLLAIIMSMVAAGPEKPRSESNFAI